MEQERANQKNCINTRLKLPVPLHKQVVIKKALSVGGENKTLHDFIIEIIEHGVYPKEILEDKTVGIYFLFENESLVYIGSSRNIKTRIATHNLTYDNYFFAPYAEDDLNEAELTLIYFFQPPKNRAGKKMYDEDKFPFNHRVYKETRNYFEVSFAELNIKAVDAGSKITKEWFLETLINRFSKKVTLEMIKKNKQ